jgi:hypothetical protein
MAVLTGENLAHALLTFDQRLRCACRFNGDRCMRQATAEDMCCDDCRDGDHDISEIVYYVAHADDVSPASTAAAMTARRGHFLFLGWTSLAGSR